MHIDGGKMCDGWPAGPAPFKFYSTPLWGNQINLISPVIMCWLSKLTILRRTPASSF
jgi:hypothetical protein